MTTTTFEQDGKAYRRIEKWVRHSDPVLYSVLQVKRWWGWQEVSREKMPSDAMSRERISAAVANLFGTDRLRG